MDKFPIGPIIAFGATAAAGVQPVVEAAKDVPAEALSRPFATGGSNAHMSMQQGKTVSEPLTRSEIDARFKLVEERGAAAKADADKGFDRVLAAIASIATDLKDFKTQAKTDAATLRQDVKDDYKNTRHTLIGVAIGAVGIVLAIVALAYTQQGNMTTANGNVLAAFAAGKEAAAGDEPWKNDPIIAPAPAPSK